MPIAINLSFGTSNGSHSGTSLLETYLDYIAENYRCAVSVGSGNDGAGFGHANGKSYPADAELAIGYPEPSLSIDLWKKYWDEIQLQITAPNNDMLEIPDTITNQAKGFTYRYRLDGTDIYITGGGPSPYSPFQEIFIDSWEQNTSHPASGKYRLCHICKGRFMGYMAAVRCSAQCTDLIYQCITRYHPDHPLDLTKCHLCRSL